jgi:pimeloyl-ACP methyl ester carboxylesterase
MLRLSVPTLLIHGQNDTVVEPWVAKAHRDLIAHSAIVWVAGGHHQLKEDPTEILEAIP